jgi:hypothetical protein
VADLLGDDLLSGYTQISTDLLEALGRMLEAVRGSRWMRRPRLKSCASTCGTFAAWCDSRRPSSDFPWTRA